MRTRYRGRIALAAATTLSFLGTIVGTIEPASAVGASDCTPVQILAFRGSGEKQATRSYTGTTAKTSGWEGETVSRAIQSYVTQSRGTTAPNPRVDDVPIVAVGPNQFGPGKGYPAVAVPVTANVSAIKTALGDSAKAGATHTADYIDKTTAAQLAAGCPSPKFVVLGYSQGAVAARWLTQLRPKSIALTELFGDPLQWENQVGNRGNGAGGNGVLRYVSTDTEKRTDNGYYSVSGPSRSALCHTGDPICDYNWLLAGVLSLALHQTEQHKNYAVQAAESAREGQTISRAVAGLLAASAATKLGIAPSTVEPEPVRIDDIDVQALMSADSPVVDADSAAAYLQPLAAEAPESTIDPRSPMGPRTYSATPEAPTLTVRDGDTIRLNVADLPSGTEYGFRVTAKTDDGSWRLPAVLTSGVQTSNGGPQTVELTIQGIPPGTYSAGILSGVFTHTPDIQLTVLP